MRTRMTMLAAAVLALCGIAGAREGSSGPTALETIREWPQLSQQAAQRLIEKYGEPQGVNERKLVWYDNGPWKRTVVHRDETPHNFPTPHTDVVTQTVAYRAPVDKFDELAAFNGSVVADRTRGELSSSCDREEMNFLALNLADEIANGKRDVGDARQFFGRTAALAVAGRSSEYSDKLLFKSPRATADADQPLPELEAVPEGREADAGQPTRDEGN